MFYEKGI